MMIIKKTVQEIGCGTAGKAHAQFERGFCIETGQLYQAAEK
jgi:hypothetical protein